MAPTSSSSSRSSDGNSSLLDEGGSASQVPQASVQLAGYGSVVWPDSLSEWLVWHQLKCGYLNKLQRNGSVWQKDSGDHEQLKAEKQRKKWIAKSNL